MAKQKSLRIKPVFVEDFQIGLNELAVNLNKEFSKIPILSNYGPWENGKQYNKSDIIRKDDNLFYCLESHISNNFQDDLNSKKWTLTSSAVSRPRIRERYSNTPKLSAREVSNQINKEFRKVQSKVLLNVPSFDIVEEKDILNRASLNINKELRKIRVVV